MQEAQLVSELLAMQLDGLQDKKNSLADFYKHLDYGWGAEPKRWGREGAAPISWLSRSTSEDRFRHTIEAIDSLSTSGLAKNAFRRLPLFYTLYSVVYHRLYGVPGVQQATPAAPLDEDSRARLVTALGQASELLNSKVKADELSGWQRELMIASAQQTDNIGPRRARFTVLWDLARLGA